MSGLRWSKVREAYRVRPGYWFAPKLFGYGATPVTWQGWASVAVLVGAGIAIAALAERYSLALLVLLLPLFTGFIFLAHAKTDGGWRWRWGPDRG